ncbi:MAG: cysJ [Puniceicoccaceae bacterium 5H]|nr:MAG: cysJ [Puniceicoccaceae bacterium 5H]
MPQNIQIPDNAPFAHEQKVALNALLPTLQPAQAMWLGGYFGALGQAMLGGGAAKTSQAPAAAAPASAPTVPLLILFGSESGNSEGCAQEADKAAKAAGFKSTVVDMADYDMSKIKDEENVLVIVSTWGEGEPPQNATPFYEFMMGDQAPKLEKMRFSVCGLGDTGYADFCQCGKDFDKRLADLGAERIYDRQDCDVEFEAPFREWLNGAMEKMVEATGVKEQAAAAPAAEPAAAPAIEVPSDFKMPGLEKEEGYSKKNPFPAKIKNNFVMNAEGSAKEVLHVEIDLEGSGMTYEPGDALGVIPSNCPEVADDVLRMAGFRGDELKEVDGELLSLTELVMRDYDITSLSRSLVRKYLPFAKNKALDKMLEDENKEKLSEWLWGREIRDLFAEFPPADSLTVDQLLNLLRSQPPRLYSIASSLRKHPDEVHLTVGAVRYNAHGRERKGVCSTFFADRVQAGDTVPVYMHHNKNFKLPADPDTPIIMVGPGTGIAPFRSFVEDREATGARGRNWLFFGDQRFLYDFYYQTEWQDYLKSGILTKMDVAFSRDTDKKVYVQDRMREKAKELYAWIEEGAYFYVCGDASRMAKDVHQAMIDIVKEHGGMSQEDAAAYVKKLQKEKRYQRDVY